MVTVKPLVGLSSCLLGSEVRYDGGHKHNRYVTGTLADHLEFRDYCPEMAIGLGVPRAPIHLVESTTGIRVVNVDDPRIDVTNRLADYARGLLPDLRTLSGYIVKRSSPSCGMERVKVYRDGMPMKSGRGAYTATVMDHLPNLPVEEEGRLMDTGLRNNFITRVFTYHRWQQQRDVDTSAAALVDFHTRHKFLIQAHHEAGYRELGRLVADAGNSNINARYAEYETGLMNSLSHLATEGSHANVLMHIMGFFKKSLGSADKQELLEVISNYRSGLLPLAVPITLLNHHLRHHPDDYIGQQVYLQPAPGELKLYS